MVYVSSTSTPVRFRIGHDLGQEVVMRALHRSHKSIQQTSLAGREATVADIERTYDVLASPIYHPCNAISDIGVDLLKGFAIECA